MTRRRIFDWVRPLDTAQYGRVFPIGLERIDRTLTHIMISEWYYVQRMLARDVPPYAEWPIRQETPPPFATLEAEWTAQADRTRAALVAVSDWEARIEYGVTTDEGESQIVTTTAADLFTQLVLHEVHHRAQAMNMLRHLGVAAQDLDFNSFFDRRAAPSP